MRSHTKKHKQLNALIRVIQLFMYTFRSFIVQNKIKILIQIIISFQTQSFPVNLQGHLVAQIMCDSY